MEYTLCIVTARPERDTYFSLFLIGFRHEHDEGRATVYYLFRSIVALLLLFIFVSLPDGRPLNSAYRTDRAILRNDFSFLRKTEKIYDNRPRSVGVAALVAPRRVQLCATLTDAAA